MGRVARRLDLAQTLSKKYGGQIGDLLGLQYRTPSSFTAGNLEKGVVGHGTYGAGIEFDRKFLRTADRKDFRGAVIHELTHTIDPGYLGKSGEARADMARWLLNPRETEDWKPSHDVRALARKTGVDVAEYRGSSTGSSRPKKPNASSNGQGANKPPGSGSQTPGGKALPALTPSQNAAYYDQLAAAYSGYQNTLMGLRQERVGLRTAFKTERTAIRGELIGNLSGIQNTNIERGTLSSSAAMQEEIGARADAETQRSAAKNEMLSGLAYNRISQSQAAVDYAMQRATMESQKLAQQQELLALQLENNTMTEGDTSTRNNGGGGGGAGGTGGGNGGGGGTDGTGLRRTAPAGFPGNERQWRKLSPDEKFRYTIGAKYLRTPPPTNSRGGAF